MDAPSPRRSSAFAPLGLALLCGHCAAGGLLLALSGTGLLALPTLFGVQLSWVLPPVLILGGFGAWLWSGRRAAAEACALPAPDAGKSGRAP